jgi:hypothetical protein
VSLPLDSDVAVESKLVTEELKQPTAVDSTPQLKEFMVPAFPQAL